MADAIISKLEIKPYAPGSKDAVSAGCKCPIKENNNGSGAYLNEKGWPVFWFNLDCPLHGKSDPITLQTKLHDT
jgi:hypothetical protein